MAFPPPTLPTNFANSTPQQDDHPAAHNAVSAAVNDITAKVQALNTELGAMWQLADFGLFQASANASNQTGTFKFMTSPAINIPAGRAGYVVVDWCVGVDWAAAVDETKETGLYRESDGSIVQRTSQEYVGPAGVQGMMGAAQGSITTGERLQVAVLGGTDMFTCVGSRSWFNWRLYIK